MLWGRHSPINKINVKKIPNKNVSQLDKHPIQQKFAITTYGELIKTVITRRVAKSATPAPAEIKSPAGSGPISKPPPAAAPNAASSNGDPSLATTPPVASSNGDLSLVLTKSNPPSVRK